MHKSSRLSFIVTCLVILPVVLYSGCRWNDSSASRVKGDGHKTEEGLRVKPKAFDIMSVCPSGPNLECYLRYLQQLKEGKLEGIEPAVSALCKFESPDKDILILRQAICYWEAKILAARGRFREAKTLREGACRLNLKMCIERQEQSYQPDFFEVFDLAPQFCAPGAVQPGLLKKSVLLLLCSLKVDLSDSQKLEQAWVETIELAYKPILVEIKNVQRINRGKKVELDFTGATEKMLHEFYRSLKTRAFPFRVSFELFYLDPFSAPMVYFVSEAQKETGGDQGRRPSLLLNHFLGTDKKDWMSGFSGYVGLLPKDLFTLSRRLQIFGTSAFKIKVTGTVVGYFKMSPFPVPVVILD